MVEETFYYLIIPENSRGTFLAMPAGRPGILAAHSAEEILKKMRQDTTRQLGPFAPKGPNWVRYDPAVHGPLAHILNV